MTIGNECPHICTSGCVLLASYRRHTCSSTTECIHHKWDLKHTNWQLMDFVASVFFGVATYRSAFQPRRCLQIHRFFSIEIQWKSSFFDGTSIKQTIVVLCTKYLNTCNGPNHPQAIVISRHELCHHDIFEIRFLLERPGDLNPTQFRVRKYQ